MGTVVGPGPTRLDELASGDHRRVPDNGDQITLTSRLDAQHAEAVLGVMERDAVDQAGEDFGGSARSLCLRHAPIMETDVRGRYSMMRRKLQLSATRRERPWQSQPLPNLPAATFLVWNLTPRA